MAERDGEHRSDRQREQQPSYSRAHHASPIGSPSSSKPPRAERDSPGGGVSRSGAGATAVFEYVVQLAGIVERHNAPRRTLRLRFWFGLQGGRASHRGLCGYRSTARETVGRRCPYDIHGGADPCARREPRDLVRRQRRPVPGSILQRPWRAQFESGENVATPRGDHGDQLLVGGRCHAALARCCARSR
jgi:hypothetical protein